LLVLVMPGVELFHHRQPAAIDRLRIELGEPGPQSLRDSIGHPETNFIAALYGVLPPLRFLDPDTKDAAHRFAAHGGAELLAVFPVGPWRHNASPGLAVGEQSRSPLADGLHVQLTQCAAAGIRDEGGMRIYGPDLVIPKRP